jgi:hypothetical protein
MMKSGTMRWAEHIASLGRGRIHGRFWRESQKEIDQQDDLDVGGRKIINQILEKQDGGGMDWIDLAQDRD